MWQQSWSIQDTIQAFSRKNWEKPSSISVMVACVLADIPAYYLLNSNQNTHSLKQLARCQHLVRDNQYISLDYLGSVYLRNSYMEQPTAADSSNEIRFTVSTFPRQAVIDLLLKVKWTYHSLPVSLYHFIPQFRHRLQANILFFDSTAHLFFYNVIKILFSTFLPFCVSFYFVNKTSQYQSSNTKKTRKVTQLSADRINVR